MCWAYLADGGAGGEEQQGKPLEQGEASAEHQAEEQGGAGDFEVAEHLCTGVW